MQQTVRLLDDLGERYGSEHVYCNLRSPAEAIKLLCINHPALQKELVEAHQHGVGYTLVQAGTFLGYEDLQLPLGKNDLVLTPVVAGSGGGGGTNQILLGVGLVALAIVAAPLGAGFLGLGAGAFTATTGAALVAGTATSFAATAALSAASIAIGSIGASLILSGVSQMLAPQPTIPTLQNRTAPGQNTNASGPQGVSRATSGQQSYAFSGPANTVGVGATVPLVYGKLLVGSHLISSKVEVTSESDPTSDFFITPGKKTITINGEKVKNEFESLSGLRTRKYFDKQVRIQDSLTGSQEEGAQFQRRKIEKIVEFDSKNKITLVDDLKDFGVSNKTRENLQILIEINNGLSRVIGDKTVPAFVTYEIVVEKENYDAPDSPDFATARGTIQGLLRSTESYKFCHAIAYAVTGEEDSGTRVRPTIRIIDSDAGPGQQFVVRGVGYNHFFTSSENRTEGLSET
jgi:predicted phage tail protein|tara:strand:- start:824 stop:2203 length:1380 start_codon:yes stop_codon:yes gene_type:complete